MRALSRAIHRRASLHDEDGVTLVIVTLCLVALFGMLVLVVDVGGLLLNRREMVNASDAAALSAAKSCILPASLDPMQPEDAADKLASENSPNAKWSGVTNIRQITSPCKPANSGYVSVRYQADQHLFFASVLGGGSTGSVMTQATAVWGPPKAVNPLPLVVYSNVFHSCKIDSDPTPGPTCYIWEDNSNTAGAASGFGYLDLRTDDPTMHGWDSKPGVACDNTGLIKDWVANYPDPSIGDLPVHYPATTYVCRLDGGPESVFGNDVKKDGPIYNLIDPTPDDGDQEHIIFFPLNRCDKAQPATFGQIDNNGKPVTCGVTPHQYDIIGFVALRLVAVYTPKEAGTSTTACGNDTIDFKSSTVDIDLDTRSTACLPYDDLTNVQLTQGTSCCTLGVDYSYDQATHVIDWLDGDVNNVHVTWDAATNGACGTPPSKDNSGHCLMVKVEQVVLGGSDPQNSDTDSNIRAYRLCDPAVQGSCTPFNVPQVP